jgi:hypothetical protein
VKAHGELTGGLYDGLRFWFHCPKRGPTMEHAWITVALVGKEPQVGFGYHSPTAAVKKKVAVYTRRRRKKGDAPKEYRWLFKYVCKPA